jgi:sodium-dependent dicarboxylate transporter 2/3/5
LRTIGWVAGPGLGLLAAWGASSLGVAAAVVVGVTLWTAVWWLTEPVDAAVASLLPVALFPLAGVLTGRQVAEAVGNDLLLLLGGGFMLSTALERTGAHRHLAVALIRAVGGNSGRRVLLAFMASTALLSMWVSNTAATLMLLPVARAVLESYADRRLDAPLVLGVAYAASIGGLGTPIGTPPNLVFMSVYTERTGHVISFLEWMQIGVPAVLCLTLLTWLWLGRGLDGAPAARVPTSGAWTPAQRRVVAVFALVALAWSTRTAPWGGWASWTGLTGASDASVALLGVLLMCLTPSGEGSPLLSWSEAEEIPWGTLVLFGGGLTIAAGFEASGVSQVVATALTSLGGLPVGLLVVVLCAGVTAFSEIASNTAAAVLLMPILATTGQALGVDPALFMLPAGLAASCGFALPVATGPNAIAYGTGMVDNRTMMREGVVVDLLGVVVLSSVCWARFA